MSFGRFLQRYFTFLLPAVFCVYLVLESYQIDFRPYYVAGRSVLLGLDPYLNPVTQYPELYAAVNGESVKSGLIYPPLSALLFTPLALLPYSAAKLVFAAILLACLWGLLWLVVDRMMTCAPESVDRTIGPELTLAACSLPVLASFERGQIDLVVCILTIVSFLLYQLKPQRSAALLALAIHIKVFPALLLLYYLAKREFKWIGAVVLWIVGLGVLPLFKFQPDIYHSFCINAMPKFCGQRLGTIETHGQQVIANRAVSIEGNGLTITHDFVHGYLNPFLRKNLPLALIIGTIALLILLYYLRRQPPEQQFYSAVNAIHLANPSTWIMGLVWYLPLFIYSFGRANTLGKFVLALPLFLPPALNASGMVAYAVTLAFAVPQSRDRLVLWPTEQPIANP